MSILTSLYFFFLDLTPKEIHKIREAIKNASSLQEVERLTRMLQSGQIPGQKPLQPQPQTNGQRNNFIRILILLLRPLWHIEMVSKCNGWGFVTQVNDYI